MILNYFIPILAQYLHPDMVEMWFNPMIALCFIATVPCIIKQFTR